MTVQLFGLRQKARPDSGLYENTEQALRAIEAALATSPGFKANAPIKGVAPARIVERFVVQANARVLFVGAIWDEMTWERAHFILDHPRDRDGRHPMIDALIYLAKLWGHGGAWFTFLHDRAAPTLKPRIHHNTFSIEGTRWMVAALGAAAATVACWGRAGARLDLDRQDHVLQLLEREGFLVFRSESGFPSDQTNPEPLIGGLAMGDFKGTDRNGVPAFRAKVVEYVSIKDGKPGP